MRSSDDMSEITRPQAVRRVSCVGLFNGLFAVADSLP
jgi:hypothetical protein